MTSCCKNRKREDLIPQDLNPDLWSLNPMKSRVVFFLAAALCAALPAAAWAGEAARPDPGPARSTPFPDVPRDHWAFDAVEQLRQRGILRGYPPAAAKPSRQAEPRKRGASIKKARSR
ncbi:MAG: S-layer homology domain-containing protein [Armatimonadota bacterium]